MEIGALLAILLEIGNGPLGKLGLVVVLDRHHREDDGFPPAGLVFHIEFVLDIQPLDNLVTRSCAASGAVIKHLGFQPGTMGILDIDPC